MMVGAVVVTEVSDSVAKQQASCLPLPNEARGDEAVCSPATSIKPGPVKKCGVIQRTLNGWGWANSTRVRPQAGYGEDVLQVL